MNDSLELRRLRAEVAVLRAELFVSEKERERLELIVAMGPGAFYLMGSYANKIWRRSLREADALDSTLSNA